MKNLVINCMVLLLSFNISCHKEIDIDEFYVPDVVEIKGINSVDFATKLNQEIKFITDDDTLFAKVLTIENTLCPSNPGIICFVAGYLIASFAVNCKEEKDTVELKNGIYHSPDNSWLAENDSALMSFNNFNYILYLVKAEYYQKPHPDDIEKKEGLFLTMNLKKI